MKHLHPMKQGEGTKIIIIIAAVLVLGLLGGWISAIAFCLGGLVGEYKFK